MADALSFSLVEHDLGGKPGSTFPDHALTGLALRATGEQKGRRPPEGASGGRSGIGTRYKDPAGADAEIKAETASQIGQFVAPDIRVLNLPSAATRTATRYLAPAGPMAPAACW
jgi:hypothetical protein